MPNLGFRIGPRGRCLGQRRVIAGGAGRLHVHDQIAVRVVQANDSEAVGGQPRQFLVEPPLALRRGSSHILGEQSRVMGRLLIDPVRELSVHLSHAEAQCGQRAQGREHEPGGDQAQEERAPGVVEKRVVEVLWRLQRLHGASVDGESGGKSASSSIPSRDGREVVQFEPPEGRFPGRGGLVRKDSRS